VRVTSASADSPSGVGATALGAAEMRAEESVRPDRLFDDPYAAAFVAAAPPLFPEMASISDDPEIATLKAAFSASIVVRTRFYDDYLSRASGAGCRQVVILAAGLDTRAFRLHWPTDVRLFELDLPAVLAFKEAVLAEQRAEPRCVRITVGTDLREDWRVPLTDAGFSLNARTAWLAEGLLPYLSTDDAARLLSVIGELSSEGSQLSFEYDEFADDATLAQALARPEMQEVTSMWKGGLSENAVVWLRRHGWKVSSNGRSTLATQYRRPIPDSSTAGFLTATRLA
jgi:methyltransferase (TIGR00027 family)